MSTSFVLNRWLNRLYKTIAVLLVLVAVLMSAVRLFLPYAHHYKGAFEDYINGKYQSGIAINTLTLGWKNFGPTLIAKDVTLLETASASIVIDDINIHVNFWESVKQQKLVARNLTLDGVAFNIDQALARSSNGTTNDQQLLDDTLDLFLTQISQFSLKNSQLLITNGDIKRKLLINHLNWRNTGERHLASGDVKIDGVSSNHLKLLVDLSGTEKSNLTGQVYLHANELNITPWLDNLLAVEGDNVKSDINFSAWLDVKDGRSTQLLFQLAENEIAWQEADQVQTLGLSGGQILLLANHDHTGFLLDTSFLAFKVNEKLSDPFRIGLVKNSNGISGNLSSLDLSTLDFLAPLLIKEESTLSLVQGLDLKGNVEDLFFKSSVDKGLMVSTSFDNVNVRFSQGIPGVDNISGQALYADDQFKISLLAQDGHLDFSKHFMYPIPYSQIKTEVFGTLSDEATIVKVKDIQFTSHQLEIDADVQVEVPAQGKAEMSLLASVANGNAEFAPYFYPHLLMGDDLVNYLTRAIKSGKIEHAAVLVNGPLSNFPFNDNSGIFVVDAELADSEFSFDAEWPSIKQFDANLNFTNNSMLITGRDGELSGLNVTGVEAAIEELKGSQILTVDTLIEKQSPKNVTALMLASPFEESIGATLEQVVIDKPISGNFSLMLPLKNKDDVVAEGNVIFNDNAIALQAPEMDFSQVFGNLHFRNEVITAEGVTLNWRGMPIKLTANAKQQAEYYDTQLAIDATWEASEWQAQVPDLLKRYGEGQLHWKGDLSLYNHKDGGFSYELLIDSDLKDTVLNLPAPYNKLATDNEIVQVNVKGHAKKSTINAKVGEELSFYGVLSHEKTAFTRSHLVLGDEKMLLPMDGFHITTNLEHAKLSQWQPFITDILDSLETTPNVQHIAEAGIDESIVVESTHHSLFPVPDRIRGTIENLDVIGLPLTNVSFNFLDKKDWWLLQFNAKEARSRVKFYPNWLEQGVDINADFLHVNRKSETIGNEIEGEVKVDEQVAAQVSEQNLFTNDEVFAKFPPIVFHCDSCKVDNLDLGVVDFSIARSGDDKILVKQFTASRDKSSLNLDMVWQHNENESFTDAVGKIVINDVEHELDSLGYASIIKESGLKGNFKANWQGGPQSFSAELLNGSLKINVDDGYLADVGDKARIFSVLSLQSLVRKLTLDFRDIFSDGMFYSSIKGDFEIKDGILYTDNTKMNGAAGDLVLKGNTELSEGILDYSMSYKPNLTSSLPVLAWVATLQPAVFLAGIAIDQVFTSQVVSEFNFELTGSIDEPSFREVDRKTKDISVGRSTPPQIVENTIENDKVNTETNLLPPSKNLVPKNPVQRENEGG